LLAGIVAIIFSVQARSKSQAGNYAGTPQAVRYANISLKASVVLGVLTILVALALGLLGGTIGIVASQSGTTDGGEEIYVRDASRSRSGTLSCKASRSSRRASRRKRRKL
jgi:hypothetical protein